MLDTGQIVAEIMAGSHDIARIQTAVWRFREQQQASIRWVIELPDCPRFGDGDLTLAEAAEVEKVARVQWAQIDPLQSASVAQAIAVVAYRRAGHPDPEKAAAELTTNQLIDAYKLEEQRPADPQ